MRMCRKCHACVLKKLGGAHVNNKLQEGYKLPVGLAALTGESHEMVMGRFLSVAAGRISAIAVPLLLLVCCLGLRVGAQGIYTQ